MSKKTYPPRPANRLGRRPADPDNPRRLRLAFRLSERELARIDARRGKLTRSAWVHGLVRAALAR